MPGDITVFASLTQIKELNLEMCRELQGEDSWVIWALGAFMPWPCVYFPPPTIPPTPGDIVVFVSCTQIVELNLGNCWESSHDCEQFEFDEFSYLDELSYRINLTGTSLLRVGAGGGGRGARSVLPQGIIVVVGPQSWSRVLVPLTPPPHTPAHPRRHRCARLAHADRGAQPQGLPRAHG
jgi:hypothetical protein